MRFRTLLFFISAAAVTIPCLVMGWLQYVAVEREFTEDDRTRAEISLLVSERLEAKVDNAVSLVTAAAEILKSEEGEPAEKLNLILEELCKASPDILNMHFDDPSAVSVAFSPRKNKRGESNIGVSHKDRSHWKNPYVKDGISVSGLVQAVGASDRKIVNITKPVYSNGRFVGLAVAALDLEQIAAQVLKGWPRMLIKSAFSAETERLSFLPASRFRFTISRLKKERTAASLSRMPNITVMCVP